MKYTKSSAKSKPTKITRVFSITEVNIFDLIGNMSITFYENDVISLGLHLSYFTNMKTAMVAHFVGIDKSTRLACRGLGFDTRS